MSNEPEVVTNEKHEYGRLWPDGTFDSFGQYFGVREARKRFDRDSYELESVPKSLRPVLGTRRVVTTTEIHPAEACPEGDAK